MAKTQTCRLLLMRTGSTEWDEAGRLQGSVDLPLSPVAQRGISDQVSALGTTELTVVLTGPDEASQQTAEAVAAQTGCSPKVVDDLREINLGLWEGMLASEFERRYPRVCRQWLDDPASVTAPEGEGLEGVQERVTTALARELDRYRRVGAVGVVLRPFVWGVVNCRLRSASTCQFWSGAKDAGWFEWFSVPRTFGRETTPATAKQ